MSASKMRNLDGRLQDLAAELPKWEETLSALTASVEYLEDLLCESLLGEDHLSEDHLSEDHLSDAANSEKGDKVKQDHKQRSLKGGCISHIADQPVNDSEAMVEERAEVNDAGREKQAMDAMLSSQGHGECPGEERRTSASSKSEMDSKGEQRFKGKEHSAAAHLARDDDAELGTSEVSWSENAPNASNTLAISKTPAMGSTSDQQHVKSCHEC